MASVKFANGNIVTDIISVNSLDRLYNYPKGDSFVPTESQLDTLQKIKDKPIHASYFDIKNMFLINPFGEFYVLVSKEDVTWISNIKTSPLPGMQLLGYFITVDKKLKFWRWSPKEDLNVYDFARFLPLLLTSGSSNPILEHELKDISSNWSSHFDVIDVPAQLQHTKDYQVMSQKIQMGIFG